MSALPSVTLNDGTTIPQLGLGVWQVPDAQVGDAIAAAFDAGYRSVDTAAIYGNEVGTGAAIAASGLAREDVHVTTKLWNTEQGYDSTLRAFDESLTKLGLDHVDLYLIHWQSPERDLFVETFKAFEKIKADGRARSIGVSNFHIPQLRRLIDETGTIPSVNQIELHPNLPQKELRAFHAEHGIVTQAWSPLAQGNLIDDAVIGGLADKHGKTPAQILLRWHVQIGNVVIPKSVTPSRIAENIAVFDFELDANDLAAIDVLENGRRTGPDPDTFNA